MMRYLLYILVFAPFFVSAQITIDQDDMPNVGDIFSFSITTDTVVSPELTGANYSWDFSGLSEGSNLEDMFVGVSSTPLVYQFYFNNGFLYPDYTADVAVAIGDITAGPVSLTDTYNYFKNDSEGYRQVGYGASINDVPQSYRLDPIEWVYEFPLNYNDSFEGSSFVEMDVPGLGYRSSQREISTEVDGWGVLSLPMGDFEVLRVKKMIAQSDSIYNELVGFGINVPVVETIEYQWLAKDEAEPVLKVTVRSGVVTDIKYMRDIPTGINGVQLDSFVLFPNPATRIINLSTSDEVLASDISIVSYLGQQCQTTVTSDKGVHSIDVSSLSPGIYVLQIKSEGEVVSRSFVVE